MFSKINKKNVILELQARREREGFGKFPSFIGFEYEKYIKKLREVKGISVWCQTGGWSKEKELTFIDGSFWNELNAITCLKLFEGENVPQILKNNTKIKNIEELLMYIHYADCILNSILYSNQFSCKEIYFRRVKIPNQIMMNWESITVNNPMIYIYKQGIHDINKEIQDITEGLMKLKKMKSMAKKLKIKHSTEFENAMKIIALIKISVLKNETDQNLKFMIDNYNKENGFYQIFYSRKSESRLLKIIASIVLREKKEYRLIDKFILNKHISKFILSLVKMHRKFLPDFTNKRAMDIETIFK